MIKKYKIKLKKIGKLKIAELPGKAGGSVTMPVTKGGKRKNEMSQEAAKELVKQIKINKNEKRIQTNTNNRQNTDNLQYDNTKKLTNEIEGEKYLIVHRTDDGLTMKDMSPILLATALKTVTNNGNITCRTLKSGDILVKTENVKQAKNLIKLTKIAQTNIEITEHKSLNTCRGVVSAYELKYEEEDTLLNYLKSQNVTKVQFHTKKIGNERVKSGLAFVTFGTNEPPEFLTIGCLRLKVRPYIPAPMRCFVCNKFGHISKVCPIQNMPKCYNCNEEKHIETSDEKCTRPPKCVNCGSNEHNSYSRSCNELKRQVEIQTIKVTQKVSFSEAVKRSNIKRNSYAQVTANKSNNNTTKQAQCQCVHCDYHKTRSNKERPVIEYDDLSDNELQSGQNVSVNLGRDIATESAIVEKPPERDDQHTENSKLEH